MSAVLFPRLLQPPRQSFFLFGPRGSGKSTWVKQRFAGAMRLDLLNETLFHELLVRPAGFSDRLRSLKRGSWVCVDEVQRLPGLLNEVHQLIEDRGLKFVLLGSSARKLRRAGVNLLAGRALRRSMHPLLPFEMERRFELEKALRYGTMPIVVSSSDPSGTLEAYTQSYLREEVQAEALVRNLAGFARFLQVAALMHGQLVNVSNIAREAGVSRTTVVDHLDVLEDTLLAFRLPAWEAKLRLRERTHPKLFWVDPGIVRAAKRQLGPVAAEERGPLLEGFIATVLRGWNDYRGLYDELTYWAPTESEVEVDFLLRRGKRFVAIEVKGGSRFRPEDARGLRAIEALPGLERRVLLHAQADRLSTRDGIDVLGVDAFLREVETGRL